MPFLRSAVDFLQTQLTILCPKPEKKQLEEHEQKRQDARLEGFAYFYVILWVVIQMGGFVLFWVGFMFSPHNEFMATKSCCISDYTITDAYGIPDVACSQDACVLHDFPVSTSSTLSGNRPRSAKDGDYSIMFSYDDQQWCCNLHATDTQCCDRMPYTSACGLCLFAAAFCAICSMLMSTVILMGVYSFTSRRSPWYTVGMATIPAMLIRIFTFLFIYYIFYGFVFSFLFGFIAMMKCDNPYAYDWYKFGWWYFVNFFRNMSSVWGGAVSSWDGKMDTDAFVGCTTAWAVCWDLFFTIFYGITHHCQNKDKKYLDLTYFNL